VAAPQALGTVVGENLRRLREQSRLTQHETARLLQRYGLRWSRSKIAAIESGERPNIGLVDVLILAMAFNIGLADLFEGNGDVILAGQIALPRHLIRELLLGKHVREQPETWDPDARRENLIRLEQTLAAFDTTSHAGAVEADQALASRLHVPVRVITGIALSLWDRTLTDERDTRVADLGDLDPGERQAHRGHITRELSQQIETALSKEPE
jgi:transcriptional regulator with XRE-family HTH domain